ncbi:MAG: TonB-dependent receptor [Muribaculaceae bacterium]|nr:TonB-dependent receptor [Muribaculaceae bacterium]
MHNKVITLVIITVALATTSFARTGTDSLSITDISGSVPTDTTMTGITLGEITVNAPKVIHKADMDVLYPSKTAVKASQNGMSLLKFLMIPTMTVNELTGSIRTAGQDVEIRINGRKASADQLQTIDPATVKRVEWIDDAGLRYGDAPAVLNVILVNPTIGGSFMAQGMQSFTQPWGNGYADLKINHGRSQWSLGAMGRYTNHIESYREYSETFTRPDGASVTRTESPIDGYVSMTSISPKASYNYINPDKTVVWVAMSLGKDWPTVKSNTGMMTLSSGDAPVILYEKEATSGLRPRFNAYVEHKLPHSQTIALDLNASVLNGRSSHDYRESSASDNNILTDVRSDIRNRQQNLNIEGNYIKRFGDKRLTAGIQYSGLRSRTTHENGSRNRQRQERAYMFGEYFQRVGRVNLTAGLGAQYTTLKAGSDDHSNSAWSLRPRISASYRLSNSSQFRLSFTGRTTAPTPSQTDNGVQQIDGFQYQTGNPGLRSYNTYNAKAQYNFTFPRVSGQLEGRWSRAPHAIAPFMRWEGEKLVTMFENSRGHTSWQVSLSPQVEIIPGILTAKGTLRFYTAHTSGNGYTHRFHCLSGDAAITAVYRSFIFSASYESNPSTLWGETVSRQEQTSTLMLGYRWRGFTFTGGMFMPFTRYSMGSESLNRYNTNRNVLRSPGFDRMPVVQISYNLNWGRQKKGATKLINAEDDIQQSTAAGR